LKEQPGVQWSAWTGAQPTSARGTLVRQLLQHCRAMDAGLERTAQHLAEHQAARGELLSNDEVTFELRAAGVPHVWPRAWLVLTDDATTLAPDALSSFSTWMTSFHDGGQRRCGLGRAALRDSRTAISVVAVDAVAALKPLPRRVRTGHWLEVEAEFFEETSLVEVVALGPTGGPRSISASLRNNVARARVRLDRAGAWLIQVLPTLANGPRPALEAMVFADQEPPKAFEALSVPGEHAGNGAVSPRAMLLMLNAARASEGLPPLAYDEQLEVAATIHAKAMFDTQRVAHDVGMGTPVDRIAALELTPVIAGENVAHASTLERSHRALWASPSHRANMLHPKFTHVGIGYAEDPDGSLWVCQVFAAFGANAPR
jgi:uncharacterized protein YkwD